MFKKIKKWFKQLINGFIMVGISMRYIYAHPALVTFGFVRAFLFCLCYPALFYIFYYVMCYIADMKNETASRILLWLFLITTILACFYIFFLIALWTSVATIDYVLSRLNNEPISVGTSLKIALKRMPTIALWAAVNSIVYLFLNLARDKRSRASTWQRLAGEALTIAWISGTFFVNPIIAQERLSLWQTIKKSALLFKQHFAEVTGLVIGYSIITAFIFPVIPGTIISLINKYLGSEMTVLNAVINANLFLLFLFLRTIVNIGQDIFKAAAYNNVQGASSGPFTPQLIQENLGKSTQAL